MIDAKIKLPNFKADFDKNIRAEINKVIRRSIGNVTENIKRRIQKSAENLIKGSPEYQSFFGGRLQAELGVPDPIVMDAVITKWIQGIQVKYNTTGGYFGSISIGMIQADYSDVLTMPEASYNYASGRGGGVIEWLRWLLLEGNNAIVRDYSFTDAKTRGSRTGLGVMVSRKGQVWRVPPEFEGTANDNFVLRALETIDKEIDNIVRQEITKGIK